ncbi:MAG: hypothetical protein R3B93_08710 [Bacteroidia bacterium]
MKYSWRDPVYAEDVDDNGGFKDLIVGVLDRGEEGTKIYFL